MVLLLKEYLCPQRHLKLAENVDVVNQLQTEADIAKRIKVLAGNAITTGAQQHSEAMAQSGAR
ncbi:hypothetical protein ESA_01631 [Cronobacter sakazakii ATCC BAA-894]|uniref:Uncharacterized protein n=1 Tax=Cronobacter sakazakii (strain ATCC BAA-894) TaxID=290339 RepID=A7MGI9_CROS8|nr:hypothetical protein ESA_01631 [Cronobacter sakazakii ATCC BAA-894]